MKISRSNEANTIAQVDTFYPEDNVRMGKDRISIPLLAEFLGKLQASDPLRLDPEHPPGVQIGFVPAQKGGFELLVLVVDSGITYVVAPLDADDLQRDDKTEAFT